MGRIFFVLLSIIGIYSRTGEARIVIEKETHSHTRETNFRCQLAVVAIFKNEAPYLKEWIEYHRLLGVEHFYLYNNLSNDGYLKVLSPYIKKKIVSLIKWDRESDDIPSWNAVQCVAYRQAIDKAKNDSVKWLAILDSDEFLVPRDEDSLLAFLENYDAPGIGGVRVLWVMFGTSYVDKIPQDKTMIETLILNGGYTQGIKKTRKEKHPFLFLVLCG